jgi:hypothetical protein
MTETTANADAQVEAMEEEAAEAEAKGYRGDGPEYDRDAYTLRTGPDSPSALEATLDAKRAELDAQLDEFKERVSARADSAKAKHGERKAARQSKREGS